MLIMIMTGFAARSIYDGELKVRQEGYRVAGDSLQRRIRNQLRALNATGALFRSQGVPNREQFKQFVETLDVEHDAPGIQGIGFALAQRPGDGSSAERLEREYGVRRVPWPVTNQPAAFPIVLLEPDIPANLKAMGYDMFSHPVRREAMTRAWETGERATTDPVTLVQEELATRGPGFLVYIPIFAAKPGEGIKLGSFRPILGFVYAPYRVHQLVPAAIPSTAKELSIRLYAGRTVAAPLTFSKGPPARDAITMPISIADRDWTLVIGNPDSSFAGSRAQIVLSVGSFGALMVGLLLWLLSRQARAALTLAEERRRRAGERELVVQEMAHRQKNAMSRIVALVNVTAREAKDVEDFSARLNGRLMAMSDAQNILVHATASDNLRQLVNGEIARAGSDPAHTTVEGGPTELDDRLAQSLALVLHELATNSVKYGALGGKGHLSVRWHHEADGALAIEWREDSLPQAPQFGAEGFGTRLIRTLIERQHNGRFERIAEEHAFIARFSVPG